MTQAHLSDLFKTGELVTIDLVVDGEPCSYDIWMRKPTIEQQQQARVKGNAASARLKRVYRDKESDQYIALWDSIADVETAEEAIEGLVQADRTALSSKAYHEVLWGEFGSNWSDEEKDGAEGLNFDGIVDAQTSRMDEIQAHNISDSENMINPDEDEELLALRASQAEFDAEWEACTEIFMKEEQGKYKDMSLDELRDLLAKESIGLESLMAFHQEYRIHMLHYACRNPEKGQHKKLYWNSKDDILELPLSIQTQLLNKLDQLQSADPKVSATPRSF